MTTQISTEVINNLVPRACRKSVASKINSSWIESMVSRLNELRSGMPRLSGYEDKRLLAMLALQEVRRLDPRNLRSVLQSQELRLSEEECNQAIYWAKRSLLEPEVRDKFSSPEALDLVIYFDELRGFKDQDELAKFLDQFLTEERVRTFFQTNSIDSKGFNFGWERRLAGEIRKKCLEITGSDNTSLVALKILTGKEIDLCVQDLRKTLPGYVPLAEKYRELFHSTKVKDLWNEKVLAATRPLDDNTTIVNLHPDLAREYLTICENPHARKMLTALLIKEGAHVADASVLFSQPQVEPGVKIYSDTFKNLLTDEQVSIMKQYFGNQVAMESVGFAKMLQYLVAANVDFTSRLISDNRPQTTELCSSMKELMDNCVVNGEINVPNLMSNVAFLLCRSANNLFNFTSRSIILAEEQPAGRMSVDMQTMKVSRNVPVSGIFPFLRDYDHLVSDSL